jgi:hypothetical protein
MKRTFAIPLAVALLAGVFMQSASAELGRVGPVNPENGFPVWYEDAAATPLRLELCLDQNAFCLTEEPNPAAPIAFPDNFGPEAFWWMAEAPVTGSGIDGLLVLALEAAFAAEVPAEGQQVAFARIRIRADVPVAGSYTVTHPFGTLTFNVPNAAPGEVFDGTKAINFTDDVGFGIPGRNGTFDLALAGGIGPFLQPSDTPGGAPRAPIEFGGNLYLASPGAATSVTGSPTGNNLFSIAGPPGTASTTTFNVMGKVFTPKPAVVEKAEYRVQTGKFRVEGSTILVEDDQIPPQPTVITANIGADEIGTATVDPVTGRWVITGKVAASPGGAGRSVSAASSADPVLVPTPAPPFPPGGVPAVAPLTLH